MITVLGATGTQGGAVARALLAEGLFAVRAPPRNAEIVTAPGVERSDLLQSVFDADLAAFAGQSPQPAARFRS